VLVSVSCRMTWPGVEVFEEKKRWTGDKLRSTPQGEAPIAIGVHTNQDE
jgi:hypothetical protein